jgi:hypothetical protein
MTGMKDDGYGNGNGSVDDHMGNFDPDTLKSCLIGIGKSGKAVADEIQLVKQKYSEGSGNIIWNYFDIFIIEKEKQLQAPAFPVNQYDLIFLVGSPENPLFNKARKAANEINTLLMLSIVTNTGTETGTDSLSQIYGSEIMIKPDGDFVQMSAQLVQDFYSAFAVPPIVCLGIDDVYDGFSGSLCAFVSIEGSNEDVTDLLKNYQETIYDTTAFLLILSYDAAFDPTLDEILDLFDLINEDVSKAETILRTATRIQKIKNGMKATLLYIQKNIF